MLATRMMSKRVRALCFLFVLALVIAACATEEPDPGAVEDLDIDDEDVDDVEEVDEPEADDDWVAGLSWPDEWNVLTFPTGSEGGGGHSTAIIMSGDWEEVLGLNVEVQVGGAQTNIPLLEEGTVQLGNSSRDSFIAFYGDEWEERWEETNIRDFWVLWPAPLHIIVPDDSDKELLSDFVGTGDPISIGAPDSGEALVFLNTIACGGWDESDFNIQNLGKDESVAAYVDGLIPGWSAQGADPMAPFMEVIESPRGGKFVEVDPEVRECMVEQGLSEHSLGDTYGLEPAMTVTSWYTQITVADAPEDLIYGIVRVLHERYDDLVAAYPGAHAFTVENTVEADGFPLHPGTVRYLEEIGVDVPAERLPPELR